MWLLVDSSGQMTASILRDKICKLYSENRVMVIELDGDRDTWAGFGPTQPKNMFDWIKQNWGRIEFKFHNPEFPIAKHLNLVMGDSLYFL